MNLVRLHVMDRPGTFPLASLFVAKTPQPGDRTMWSSSQFKRLTMGVSQGVVYDHGDGKGTVPRKRQLAAGAALSVRECARVVGPGPW